MFLMFGVNQDSMPLGVRRCSSFPCGSGAAAAEVTCVFLRFSLFLIPLFRFREQYYVACPHCGAVYSVLKDEGKRLRRDPAAEIDPAKLVRVSGGTRYCPSCGAEVGPGARYCPRCGSRLF